MIEISRRFWTGCTLRMLILEQVFDAVVAECFKQQIYVHLDNHISKGMWCCGETDGNARVTCVERMNFNPDGTIQPVKVTNEGVGAHPLP